jgi:hypothetical protein
LVQPERVGREGVHRDGFWAEFARDGVGFFVGCAAVKIDFLGVSRVFPVAEADFFASLTRSVLPLGFGGQAVVLAGFFPAFGKKPPKFLKTNDNIVHSILSFNPLVMFDTLF